MLIKVFGKQISFVIISHCFLLFYCVYPIFSTEVWDTNTAGVIWGSEVAFLLFTFTIFRQDLRRRKIYETLTKNRMITLFVGPYSNLKQEGIEKISDKLEYLVAVSVKYKDPHNIVIINCEGNGVERIKLTFIFWNELDYNNFITSNRNMLIDSCENLRFGILVGTSIKMAC